jgi:hypothetical protein
VTSYRLRSERACCGDRVAGVTAAGGSPAAGTIGAGHSPGPGFAGEIQAKPSAGNFANATRNTLRHTEQIDLYTVN